MHGTGMSGSGRGAATPTGETVAVLIVGIEAAVAVEVAAEVGVVVIVGAEAVVAGVVGAEAVVAVAAAAAVGSSTTAAAVEIAINMQAMSAGRLLADETESLPYVAW